MSTDMSGPFAPRETVEQVEEGHVLAPKFDANGLIPVVTTDFTSGELLMHGYMNEDALKQTIATGEAHYWPACGATTVGRATIPARLKQHGS